MHEESILLYNERIALAVVSGSDCKWLLEKAVSGRKNMVGMATWTQSCGASSSSLLILSVLFSWTPWNPTTMKGGLNYFQRFWSSWREAEPWSGALVFWCSSGLRLGPLNPTGSGFSVSEECHLMQRDRKTSSAQVEVSHLRKCWTTLKKWIHSWNGNSSHSLKVECLLPPISCLALLVSPCWVSYVLVLIKLPLFGL